MIGGRKPTVSTWATIWRCSAATNGLGKYLQPKCSGLENWSGAKSKYEKGWIAKLAAGYLLGRVATSHKIMFKKQDEDFDEMAADPVRRRAKIADLSWRRTWIGCCALVIMFAAVAEMWSGGKEAIAGAFAGAISWGTFIKYESDLRLLRVIERLEKDRHDKTTA